MLIDTFARDWLDYLDRKLACSPPDTHLYLLLDGVCVPALQKCFDPARTLTLFSFLPGCSEESRNASPFLTPYDANDPRLKSHLTPCNGWPMVSAIHTPEPLDMLARRLAAWCVVEANGQRFHLRFADTRRLPAIFAALYPKQKGEFLGPALSWSYVSRRGTWKELESGSTDAGIALSPILDARQFGVLVSDSLEDEVLALLHRRACQDTGTLSRSHELVATAVAAARGVGLGEAVLLDWCEWYWGQDRITSVDEALSQIDTWQQSND